MKNRISKLILISCLGFFNQAFAVNYKDRIFKTDTILSYIRETQIGKNFFNAGSNNIYAYSTKMGIQLYCFQIGVNAERELINTTVFDQSYLQRTKGLGFFFGIELPVTKKIDVGLVGIYSKYKYNLEQPIYVYKNEAIQLFDLGNRNVFQTQLRFNYHLNNEFSLLGTANVNTTPSLYQAGGSDRINFFRFNVGLRYKFYPLNNGLENKNELNKSRVKIFLGSNLEWKKTSVPDFIGQEREVTGKELLNLASVSGDNSGSQVFALLGIADKRNNMILFGINQRDYIQYSKNYQQLFSSYNWKFELKDISTRLALELNLFSLANENIIENFKPVYPFLRVSATYSNKNFTMLEGWDTRYFATDTSIYIPSVNNKAQTKSVEINNSVGIAMKLNKLYISAGFNVFNRTYGEVKYNRTVTRDYYETKSPQNFIESKTPILPGLESKGWLTKPIDPVNIFFTVGLVL